MADNQKKPVAQKASINTDSLPGVDAHDTANERRMEDALEDDDVREVLKRLHGDEK